jgi:hypothetical protein
MKTHDNQDNQDPRKGADDSSNAATRITSNDYDTDNIDSAESSTNTIHCQRSQIWTASKTVTYVACTS